LDWDANTELAAGGALSIVPLPAEEGEESTTETTEAADAFGGGFFFRRDDDATSALGVRDGGVAVVESEKSLRLLPLPRRA
jgi:hypothetical protein